MAKWQAAQLEGSTLSHGCHKASLIGMRFTGSSKQEMDPVQWSQKHFGTLPQVENDGSIQVPAVYAELHSRSLAEIFWPMA